MSSKDDEKKPVVVKNATDLQRLKLEKLMKNIDKPVIIPDRPKSKSLPAPPDFVRNVMGSSAGAGSGEFHVYRHLRRKEYARQKFIQEKSEKERLDEEYKKKIEMMKKEAEEKTAKKRAKRLKKKLAKLKRKQSKIEIKQSVSSQSDSEDANETESNHEKHDDKHHQQHLENEKIKQNEYFDDCAEEKVKQDETNLKETESKPKD